MPMQCNAMLLYAKKETHFVLLTCIFPFPVTRDQILSFNENTHISSFRTKINREYGFPLHNVSGFSLE